MIKKRQSFHLHELYIVVGKTVNNKNVANTQKEPQ